MVQHLNSDLWKRWCLEYLSTLQKRTKWKSPNRDRSIGDIVLLKDEAVYQRSWPFGRVEKIVKGRTYGHPVTRSVFLLEEEVSSSSRGEDD